MNAKAKQAELEARRVQHKELIAKISKAEKTLLAEDRPVGCGGRLFAALFGGGPKRVRSEAVDQAVFGQRSQTAATDRLARATSSMEAHVHALTQKVDAARAQAKGLRSSGKRTEALAALKRGKLHEKALETAIATHAALERQVDMLEESELQKEVASALTSSVAIAKKKTKGLLSKTEDAVDGAVELRDFAEDISQSLSGLQVETYDDDELLAELEAMAGEDDSKDALSVEAKSTAPAEEVTQTAYPSAPTKKMERASLLANEGSVAAI